MKKVMLTIAVTLSLAAFGMTGCDSGDAENTVIEPAPDGGANLTDEQRQAMEADMQSGGGYSSQPGN